jgi:hypothetical protein
MPVNERIGDGFSFSSWRAVLELVKVKEELYAFDIVFILLFCGASSLSSVILSLFSFSSPLRFINSQ